MDDSQGAIPGDTSAWCGWSGRKTLRVVAKNTGAPSGDHSRKQRSFLHSRAEKFNGDWWKLILLEDLTPGEYAIVVSTAAGQDDVVWDFGVESRRSLASRGMTLSRNDTIRLQARDSCAQVNPEEDIFLVAGDFPWAI